jgi:hypothetical protein
MDQTHRPARHGQRQPCTPAGHAQHSHGQQAQSPASAGPAQPAHLAQHGHGQQQAHPAQPAQPPASAGTAQQHGQRPARALRIVTGLALLALAFFVALNGRGCLC